MAESMQPQSEGNEKILEAIDTLITLHLHDQDKVLVLLTYSGDKPLSEIDYPRGDEDGSESRALKRVFRDLRLFVRELPTDRSFLISRDPEMLEHRELAFDTEPQKERWEALGTVYGFPRTAVKNFPRNTTIEVPEEIADTPLGKFYDRAIALALSKRNRKTDLKVVRQWMESVRRIAPAYLDYLLSDDWKPEPGGSH